MTAGNFKGTIDHRASAFWPARLMTSGIVVATMLAVAAPRGLAAQEQDDLAKQLSNPLASLVSVPFQLSWDFGAPAEDPRVTMNFQPVMPFGMGEHWGLIVRLIAPYLSVSERVDSLETRTQTGLGDLTLSAFATPSGSGSITWGVGPALGLPMSTNRFLGTGKWSAGPTGIILVEPGSWTIGMLANQLWSFAGEEDRRYVNQAFFQPFIAYHLPKSITLTLNSEATANWIAPDDETWTIPLQLQASKVIALGKRPLSVVLGGGYFVEKPGAGPDWRLRTGLTLLFPMTK